MAVRPVAALMPHTEKARLCRGQSIQAAFRVSRIKQHVLSQILYILVSNEEKRRSPASTVSSPRSEMVEMSAFTALNSR